MGLEVHAELSTKSKIFCGCKAAFGGEPNTYVCPVCCGMPGTLPMLNRAVIEYAIRTGLMLNCEIARTCKFDRKNYFYPDLPKAYQVSQLYAPICSGGFVEIEVNGQKKRIRIREIHMEEDAGKLIHDSPGGKTRIDFNRAGVGLLEIVSEPDFRSKDEVLAYLARLSETLLYLGVSDCKMQEGSLRADVNISVRPFGEALGVRTEMKNINSLKAIGRAIEYESARQIEILENGGQITQETRRWDDEEGKSCGMRKKENAWDYRYFPEPDLLPIFIDDKWLERARLTLPEPAHRKRERYICEYGLSEHEAFVLTGHKNISDLFENVLEHGGEPLESAHLIMGEIMRLMNDSGTLPEDLSVDGRKLAILVDLVLRSKISRGAYKEAVLAVYANDAEPETYVAQQGLLMMSDGHIISEAVDMVLADYSDAVMDYRAGKIKVFGFLMGQVMKKLGRAGNPDLAQSALKKALDAEVGEG